jgi:hypothetical protein
MRYLAKVTIAFSADVDRDNAFDIWESAIAFEAETPRQALHLAIENSRALLDDSDNWRALGYPSEPCFYAVKSLHTDPNLPGRTITCNSGCIMLTKVATFNKSEMTRIKTFEEVLVPYKIIHLG